MRKKRKYRAKRSKDGFVQVCTVLHENHVEAIDKIVASPEAIRRGLTKRDVLYQMIAKYLNEDPKDSMQVMLAQIKLDFEREASAIRNRQHAIIEMLAMFVQIYLGHAPIIPDDKKPAFRARSKERFSKYKDEIIKVLRKRSDFFETISSETLYQVYSEALAERDDTDVDVAKVEKKLAVGS